MRLTGLVPAIASVAFASSLAAQQPAESTARAARHPIAVAYDTYKKRMMAYADSMPADEYTTRIAQGTKSYDEIIGHTIETNFGVCAGVRKETSPKKGQKFEAVVTAKPELSALLQASHEYCDPLFSQLAHGTMASSDLTFLPTHTAQMTALMESYLAFRGHELKTSEAGRAKPARP
jgi:hypothetical protein